MSNSKPAWPYPVGSVHARLALPGPEPRLEEVKKPVWPFPTRSVQPCDMPAKNVDDHNTGDDRRTVYLFEVECAQCGNPVDLYSVPKAQFEEERGESRTYVSHPGQDDSRFREDFIMGVKLKYRDCSCCMKY